MESKFYNVSDGGVKDATRLKLALFDENTVRDIIDLVNYRGVGLIDDIFRSSTESDPPHVLGILGSQYMKYNDMPGVIMGLSTVIMAQIKQPKMGEDEYADILSSAFGLPTLLARGYAKQIESYDKIIGDMNQDQSVSFMERLSQFKNILEEGARRIVNGLSNSLGLSTLINWDQSQDYDLDMLDEFHSLGEIVAKLNRRSRLMQGQALIAAQMAVFQTGDIEEDGDPMGELVGDVLAAAGSRRLPPALDGNFRDTMLRARLTTLGMGSELMNQAGVSVDPGTKKIRKHPTTGAGEQIKKLIAGVFKKSPAASLIAGAAKLTGKKRKITKAVTGDIDANEMAGDTLNLYGDLVENYGGRLADAWLTGDIDEISEALAEFESGDINDATIGDYDDGDPSDVEQGGLFTKRKKRKAKARARAKAKKLISQQEKEVKARAEAERRAFALQEDIRRKNAAYADKHRFTDTGAYYDAIDPSAGLRTDAVSYPLEPGGALDASLDADLLADVPDFDPGALFDASN